MEMPRTGRDYAIFFFGFFGSVFILVSAMFMVSFLPFSKATPSGLATGLRDANLLFGLFVLGLVAGLATVVKWRESR